MGELNFDVTGNNADSVKTAEQLKAAIRTTADEAENLGRAIGRSMNEAAANLTLGDALESQLDKGEKAFDRLAGKVESKKMLFKNFAPDQQPAAEAGNTMKESSFKDEAFSVVGDVSKLLVVDLLKDKLAGLGAAMVGNPYVMVTALLAGTAAAMWALHDSTSAAEKAQKSFNGVLEAQNQQTEELKNTAGSLISIIQNESATQYDKTAAYLKLREVMPEVLKNMDQEKLKLMDLVTFNRMVAEESNRRERIGAKTHVVIKQKELNSIESRLSKVVEDQANDPSEQKASIINGLQEEKAIARESVKLAQQRVDEIESIRSEAAKQQAKENSKEVVRDKSYWLAKQKEAREAMDAIAAGQKKLMDAGRFEGISPEVIDSYKKYSRQLEESGKSLKVYQDDPEQKNRARNVREQQKALDELLESQSRDRVRTMEDLQNQVEQSRIDAMRDGGIKSLEQMKLSHAKEMQQLERQREDLLEKKKGQAEAVFNAGENKKAAANPEYVKKNFNGSKIALSTQEESAFAGQRMNLDIRHAGDEQALRDKERRSWEEYLAEYGNFQEKKKAINDLYNDKIANTSGKGEKASLEKEKQQKLKGVEFEELKSSINFTDLYGNLDAQSGEMLTVMRDKLKGVIEQSAAGLNLSDSKALKDAFKTLDLKIAGKNPFEGLSNGMEHYKNASKAVVKAQEDLNTLQQGGQVITGVYKDETGKLCTKLLTQAQAEKNLVDAQGDRKDAQAELTKSVNTIGANGKEMVDAGNDVCNMLTSLGVDVPEAVTGVLGGLGQVTGSMASIDLKNPFSIIKGVAGALAGVGKMIGSIFNNDGKKEKNIQKMQKEVDALEKAYGDLGESVDKTFSSDASDIIDQQNVIIGQQKELIKNQMLEEQSKKKPDNEKIKAYQDRLAEMDQKIIDNKERALDAIMGEDLKAAIDNFAQAYADAWASGEDRAQSSKDFVKSMIKNMVMEALKMDLSSPMDAIRKKLEEYWSDGVIDQNEQAAIEKMVEEEMNKLDGKYAWADGVMKGDQEEVAPESTSQASTQGGFAAMSQDTGNELNGRFAALQVSNEEIRNSMQFLLGSLSALSSGATDRNVLLTEMRNLAVMSNGYLEDIARYTKTLLGFGQKLDNIDHNTRGLVGK